MITRKHLSRRTLLRGAGAALALPLLDAMTPALTAAAKTPCRMLINYLPNGMIMKEWTPAATGKDFVLPRSLEPLKPFQDRLVVLTGLKRYNSFAQEDGAGAHARTGASYLTGVGVRKNGGNDLYVGTSMDQIAAKHAGRETRLASLELTCEDGRMVGSCDPPYSCVYNNHISWRSAMTPNAPELNPRAVFERLFGSATEDPETRRRFREYERGLLDSVLEESRSLARTLGPSDRRKLDEYMNSVREIERGIEKAEAANREINPGMEAPNGVPAELSEHLGLFYDMLLVAWQADITRVVTLMVGREGSVRTFREIGISESHHPMTHHQNKAELIEKVSQINRYHVELFSRFVAKLAKTPEGDGAMLDRTMILYGAGLSDGNSHSSNDVPTVMVGGANGTIRGGRHVKVDNSTPLTNLFCSMLERMGAPSEKFGDSTGKMRELYELS